MEKCADFCLVGLWACAASLATYEQWIHCPIHWLICVQGINYTSAAARFGLGLTYPLPLGLAAQVPKSRFVVTWVGLAAARLWLDPVSHSYVIPSLTQTALGLTKKKKKKKEKREGGRYIRTEAGLTSIRLRVRFLTLCNPMRHVYDDCTLPGGKLAWRRLQFWTWLMATVGMIDWPRPTTLSPALVNHRRPGDEILRQIRRIIQSN